MSSEQYTRENVDQPNGPSDPENTAVNYLTQTDIVESDEITRKHPFDPSKGYDGGEADGYDIIRARDEERAARVEARRHPTNPIAKAFSKVCPYGGILASALNLASSSIGAGIISIPHACAVSGMAMGVFYLVLVAFLTVLSYTLLAAAADKTGLRSYASVVRELMGRGADYFLAIVLFLFSFGAEMSYVISLGDVFSAFLVNGNVNDFWKSLAGRRVVTFLVWLGVMWPLTLPKEINSLRYFSFLAVVLIIFFVIAMVVHCCQSNFKGRDDMIVFETGNSAINGLGIFMFAYISQLNAFEIYEEMYKPTVKRLTLASALCTFLCFILYLTAGVFGYLDFGSLVTGSSLKLYDPVHETLMTVAYAVIIFKLCVGYGLHMIPVRECVYYIFKIDVKVFPWWKHALIVTALGASSMVLGLFVSSVSAIFGLVGGLCGGFIGYIFPALMYMYAGNFTLKKEGYIMWFGTYVLLVCGVVGCVFGTCSTIYDAAVNGI